MFLQKKKTHILIFIIFVAIIILISTIISFFVAPSKVNALTDTSSAVQIGNGNNIYDDATQSFSATAILDLKQKLFGNNNPINMIKSKQDTFTGSYVYPASEINANVGSSEGIVLNLGGLDWIVASLTLTDKTYHGTEDVVLTLYLADSIATSQYSGIGSDSKGANMYSSSLLRKNLLSNPSLSKFVSGDFADQFLVKPISITYQHTQSVRGRVSPDNSNNYHFSNDALDDFSTGWSSLMENRHYAPGFTFNNTVNGITANYEDWGNDYIWIPSISEVGTNGFLSSSNIWGLSNEQRQHNCSGGVWARTGGLTTFNYVINFLEDSGQNTKITTATSGIRPAIHLNLSAIFGESLSDMSDPQDLTTTYNEKIQKLSEIVAQDNNQTWYNKDIYENTSNYINISAYDNSNIASDIKNAGEYWVKIEITQAYINAVNAEIDKEGLQKGWSATQINEMKQIRQPRFKKVEDGTNNGGHSETDTERWIKVTVNKAQLDFSNVKWTVSSSGNNKFEYNGQMQTITIASGLPSCVKVETWSDNNHTNVGTYTAKVSKISCSDSNYIEPTISDLAQIKELQYEWEITPKVINVRWTAKSLTENKVTLYVSILDLGDVPQNIIDYTYYKKSDLTDSITLSGIFAEYNENIVQEYWVKAVLKNSNYVLYEKDKEVTFTKDIMQTGAASNLVIATLENDKFVYNGLGQVAKFNFNNLIADESHFDITYTLANGDALVGLPTNAGKYKVNISVKSSVTDFKLIGATTFDLEIASLELEKPKETIQRTFDKEGYSVEKLTGFAEGWEEYLQINVAGNDSIMQMTDNNLLFYNVGNYAIQINITANANGYNNVVWKDKTTDDLTIDLEIKQLTIIIDSWSEQTGNKKPIVVSYDDDILDNYLDYIIYENRNGVITEIDVTSDLRYGKTYQIALRVKNAYQNNVYIMYNGEVADETQGYEFTTAEKPSNMDGEEGDGSGVDNDTNKGINKKYAGLPLYVWIMIGVIALLIILMLILIVVLFVRKKKEDSAPAQAVPYMDYVAMQNMVKQSEQNIKEEINASIAEKKEQPEMPKIKGKAINGAPSSREYTYVIREKDILNNDLMQYNDEFVFYAFKKNDIKKPDKLKKQIDYLAARENEKDTNDKDNRKK